MTLKEILPTNYTISRKSVISLWWWYNENTQGEKAYKIPITEAFMVVDFFIAILTMRAGWKMMEEVWWIIGFFSTEDEILC